MSVQPKDFSLSPVDLIEPDADEDADSDEVDTRWQRYGEISRSLDRDELLEVIADELKADEELLYQLEDVCLNPYREPDRPKAHTGEVMKLGLAVLKIMIGAVDNAVGIRQAVEELHAAVEGD
jgi:hypothetical protein